MNVALWVVQCVLAVVFAGSGGYKGSQRKEVIVASGQTGVVWFPTGFIRFIAIAELLGAVGLILPWLLGVARPLTPAAAVCLSIIMVGAAVSHARLAAATARPREWLNVATNVLIFGACWFVAIARFAAL